MGNTDYSEEGLLQMMSQLEYSLRKLRIVLTKKVPVGYYESAIERERKWNTRKNIKHISF